LESYSTALQAESKRRCRGDIILVRIFSPVAHELLSRQNSPKERREE
jgi:hypothetical protein